MRRIALIFLPIFLFSCKVDFDTALDTTIDEDIPEFVLNEAHITIVEDATILLQVDRLAYFSGDGRQEMENLRFTQHAKDNTLEFEGSTESLLLHRNEDLQMEGASRIYAEEEGATITGNYFLWTNSEQVLKGKENDMVHLQRENGSTLQGLGFFVQASSRTVQFLGNAEGRFYSGEDEVQDDEEKVQEIPTDEENRNDE